MRKTAYSKPGAPVNPHNYAAVMLAWLYGCDVRLILSCGIYRLIALDETTRRVLLGCRREGLLIEKLPKRKRKLRWGRINVGIYRHRAILDDEYDDKPRDLPPPKEPMPFNPMIARMMHLAGKGKQKRWA